MLHAIRQFAPACILLFAVMFCAVPADAGFVASTLNVVTADHVGTLGGAAFDADALLVDFGTGSMSGGEDTGDSQQSPTPEQLRMALLLQQRAPVGLQANPAPTGPTGMGHAPTDAPGPSAGVAVLNPPVPTAGELTLRTAQQRESYHPRFIKSRLFRPPRCV